MRFTWLTLAAVLGAGAGLAHADADHARITACSCQHGLVSQPPGGPFSMFVFCDDGMGVNIGVVLTEKGGGPGRIDLDLPRIWKWVPTARFWQEDQWAAGVRGFIWSPSLRYAYVATSSVSGTGHLYELDLVERRVKDLCPDCDESTIVAVDPAGGTFTAKLVFGVKSEERPFPLR